MVTYNLSKAALDQFTRTTALELASHKVRVNSVNPGVIKTEIFKKFGMPDDRIEEVSLFFLALDKIHKKTLI